MNESSGSTSVAPDQVGEVLRSVVDFQQVFDLQRRQTRSRLAARERDGDAADAHLIDHGQQGKIGAIEQRAELIAECTLAGCMFARSAIVLNMRIGSAPTNAVSTSTTVSTVCTSPRSSRSALFLCIATPSLDLATVASEQDLLAGLVMLR